MRSSALLVPALLFVSFAPTAAHASPVTYNLSAGLLYDDFQGTTYPDGTIQGTITFDSSQSAAPITFESLQITDSNSDTYLFSGTPVNNLYDSTFSGNPPDVLQTVIGDGASPTDHFLVLDFSLGNMDVCTEAASCGIFNSYAALHGLEGPGDFLVDPTLTAPTPEPSSFVLLGTGVLTMVGAARRRFRRS